jgi:starch synthase
MENKKVLFVSQEITPYLPETEMSVIARNLPQGIQERGKEIRTFMPKYGCINERRNQLHEVIRLSGMNLIIDDADHPLIIKVASIQSARMQVYFIDNEDYFQRKNILTDNKGDFFSDNDERSIFFARGVLETVRKLRWDPDIIHCHGWFTGLLPLYVKKSFRDDPIFSRAKMVYTVYNNEFTSPLNSAFKNKILYQGITEDDVDVVTDPSYVNVSKLAIDMSDGIIFGSESINDEVKSYVEKSNKPVLPYKSEEEYIDAYNEFYDKLLEE